MQKEYRKDLTFKADVVDEQEFIIRGVFSTADADRHGEVVAQEGWKLEEFMANPVILFAHDHWQPAVGKCIELRQTTRGLEGAIKFAAAEYDFAGILFRLYAGGYMSAFSVGFRNDRYEVDQETDTLTLLENTLMEISCVNVPANAMCLAYAKGVSLEGMKGMPWENATKAMADILSGPEDEETRKALHGKIAKVYAERGKSAPEFRTYDASEIEQIREHGVVVMDEGAAVGVLKNLPAERIRSAIASLTEAAGGEAAADTQVPRSKGRTPRKGGYQVKHINRAVRQLLKAKRELTT